MIHYLLNMQLEIKICIQYDGTDVGFAGELEEMGVPKNDIILAFHHPSKWEHTGFGIDMEYVNKIVNSENENFAQKTPVNY